MRAYYVTNGYVRRVQCIREIGRNPKTIASEPSERVDSESVIIDKEEIQRDR